MQGLETQVERKHRSNAQDDAPRQPRRFSLLVRHGAIVASLVERGTVGSAALFSAPSHALSEPRHQDREWQCQQSRLERLNVPEVIDKALEKSAHEPRLLGSNEKAPTSSLRTAAPSKSTREGPARDLSASELHVG